ncbi:uncharacterized protein V1518DRAFT_415798 [Limtongia smithiae]|uniref:uncharacterized protein n=1 Tax=Limtongia smithiae TaxID=1125753 RepID=UPI0034CE5D17
MLPALHNPAARRRAIAGLRSAAAIRFSASQLLSTSAAQVQLHQAESQSISHGEVMPSIANDPRETVVVVGSGWAGYNILRHLDPRYYRCVVISPRSYFVFTPLLASTAVGTLEFHVATESVRDKGMGWRKFGDFKDQILTALSRTGDKADKITTKKALELHLPSIEFVQGVATGVDIKSKEITVTPRIEGVDPTQPFSIKYDKLCVAVGCYSQTFNIKGVKEHACFLKDIADARKIRRIILERFEAANLFSVSEAEKRALLHFCIVGGGPTGIEFSAELHDLIHDDLQYYYPALMPYTQITIFDVAPQILGSFDRSLSSYAERYFGRQNIDIRTSVRVQEVQPRQLYIKNAEGKDEIVPYGLLVWSTGLAPNPFVQACRDLVKDKRLNLITDERLNVYEVSPTGEKGDIVPDVYALGDCAQIERDRLPATAQVASQKALYLAKELNREARRTYNLPHNPFKFNNRGIMAYLGGWRAILQGSNSEVTGRTAWILWRGAYLSMSVSVKNKILIPIYWFANWMFGRDITRF